ncbi:MAG: fructosamine kinase family protein [Myxococcota bacterium]
MEALREELTDLLGDRAEAILPLAGGDIGQSWRVQAGDRDLFVKTYAGSEEPATAASMVEAEARGLAWLAQPGAIRVPAVMEVSERLLVLEWIEPSSPSRATDEALGRGLAALHRAGPSRFGLENENFIGRLPQANTASESWADFYASRRLEPLLARARQHGLLSSEMERLASQLLGQLPQIVGPDEPPARLHGDLWGGNWICADNGDPVLIDPAVYGGHREIDLAMMRLFGGFGDRVFAAYREVYPLAAGFEERVPLYQLYPLLVHLNLFGAGYAAAVERAMRAYV